MRPLPLWLCPACLPSSIYSQTQIKSDKQSSTPDIAVSKWTSPEWRGCQHSATPCGRRRSASAWRTVRWTGKDPEFRSRPSSSPRTDGIPLARWAAPGPRCAAQRPVTWNSSARKAWTSQSPGSVERRHIKTTTRLENTSKLCRKH